MQKCLGADKALRQPDLLLYSSEKSTEHGHSELADYFNFHFNTIADKVKSSLRAINDFDFDFS